MQPYEYIKSFTDAYRNAEDLSAAEREYRCLAVQFPYVFDPIGDDDLFAGKLKAPEVGLWPEPLGGRGVCFHYDEKKFLRLIEENADGKGRELQAILSFWEKENTRKKIREAYPADIAGALPYDDVYYKESCVAFPLYRVVGIYLDYEKLLANGIGGLDGVIAGRLAKAETDGDSGAVLTLSFMRKELALFAEVCERYASQAESMAARAAGKRKKKWERLARTLRKISSGKPETLHEAMQLSSRYTLAAGSYNYGRMDDYLGGFLARDLESGVISKDEASEYIRSLWRLIAYRDSVFHGRVIIGGKGRRNEKTADAFALLAIEASKTVAETEPQLTLRVYEGMNEAVAEAALDCIALGRTYPMLLNDDVNIPAVANAFRVSEELAREYLPFGCGEYVLNHQSLGSPNGIINLLKALEVTIRNGFDALSGKKMGLALGRLEDFPTFESFYEAYKKQIGYYMEILARQEALEYEVVAKQAPFLLISALFDDCIERGVPVLSGGIRYLGGTVETYGNVNSANSLFAIKSLVYDKKVISPEELVKALDANFEGYEALRQKLLAAPKYGNDIDEVDGLAADFHQFVCEKARAQNEATGLHSYLVVVINNQANTQVGAYTLASADGRGAYDALANANSPAGGTDTQGATAMLNSLVKMDPSIHAGSVQNMKFSKTLVTEHRDLFRALLRTYFKQGGTQAMINVFNRGDLENAMREPEKYGNLIVRVGGFSARFVTLPKDVQTEILSRTLY
ncbi:MAG: pyruvate formate-lyase [Clostridiales bacterium]|jgi:pyruvate-formate lyase|nr:pyruvate formate-lyase [Clostridiales bacterium]